MGNVTAFFQNLNALIADLGRSWKSRFLLRSLFPTLRQENHYQIKILILTSISIPLKIIFWFAASWLYKNWSCFLKYIKKQTWLYKASYKAHITFITVWIMYLSAQRSSGKLNRDHDLSKSHFLLGSNQLK